METTKTPGFAIRPAREGDCALILQFIRSLAAYEKRPDLVTATEEGLRTALFHEHRAEVVLGEENGSPVAFALFFHNFSTFIGRKGLYLEDLYVNEDCRGKGYGKAMFAHLAKIAHERGCRRFDWSCLSWNAPSIAFYKRLGAVQLEENVLFRLDGDALKALAAQA